MRINGSILVMGLGALLSITPATSSAEQALCPGPTAPGYLLCAQDCQKDFRFTEHTDSTFAQFQSTCIQGCGQLCDEVVAKYQACYMQCKKLFKYRHGIRPEFAEFQNECIAGCRYVH